MTTTIMVDFIGGWNRGNRKVVLFVVFCLLFWAQRRSDQNVRLYSNSQPPAALKRGLAKINLRAYNIPNFATPSIVQLVMLAFSWALRRSIIPASRQTIQLKHSKDEEVFLDWFYPSLSKHKGADETVVVYIPGITGELQEAAEFVEHVVERDWTAVVFHRRGHATRLRKPIFNVFGCAEDLREAIGAIAIARPLARIALVGSSAGSAVMVRYLGEFGERAGVIAGVGISPGYDIKNLWHPIARSALDKYLVHRLKSFFVGRNRDILASRNPIALSALASAETMHDFVQQAVVFSSEINTPITKDTEKAVSFEEWLERTCPLRVSDGIAIPTLCLNGRDDPICRHEMIDDIGVQIPFRNKHCALVVTRNGSHCAFQSFHRSSFKPMNWGYTLALDFIEGVIS